MGKVKVTPNTPNTPNTPVAVLVPTTASTPVHRGNSTVNNPVGNVWVTGFNMYFTPNGTPVTPTPTRKQYMVTVTNMGVTYYTARTQIQRFLKHTQGGTVYNTNNRPRGVVLNPVG